MNIYQKIINNDEQRIKSFYQVPDTYHGNFIIKVNKPKKKDVNHKILSLYKYNENQM
jgi:hypothetical protein